MKTISVLGCGWLGFPLAKKLVQNGFSVKGSTTSLDKKEQLENEGIEAFELCLTENELIIDSNDFFNTDVLVICIPPKRSEREYYLTKIQKLNPFLAKIPFVIFTSSTAVYPEVNDEVFEDSPIVENHLYQVEQYLQSKTDTCVLRLSGLIGGNRHPGRFFAGKENIPNGLVPVNLIHQDDVVEITYQVIDQEIKGVFNVCCLEHPTKNDFYTLATKNYGGELPQFKLEKEAFKKINGEKILKLIDYQLKYKNPISVFEAI